jgi:staphylococcal nuclease domain-containing protein 1
VSQIWENYVEGEEVSNGTTVEKKQQEVLKVLGILLRK